MQNESEVFDPSHTDVATAWASFMGGKKASNKSDAKLKYEFFVFCVEKGDLTALKYTIKTCDKALNFRKEFKHYSKYYHPVANINPLGNDQMVDFLVAYFNPKNDARCAQEIKGLLSEALRTMVKWHTRETPIAFAQYLIGKGATINHEVLESVAISGKDDLFKVLMNVQPLGQYAFRTNYIGISEKHSTLFNIVETVSRLAAKNLEKNQYAINVEGTAKIVRDLIKQHGFDPNVVSDNDKHLCNPLDAACYHACLPLAKALVESGANIEFSAHHGYRPIQNAIWSGNVSMVQYMLDQGCEVNFIGNCYPPIMNAIQTDCIPVVQCLLKHKNRPSLKDCKGSNGLTPLEVCKSEKMRAVVEDGYRMQGLAVPQSESQIQRGYAFEDHRRNTPMVTECILTSDGTLREVKPTTSLRA